ncbi:MAG: tetratricopeptide repeat protein [Flavobacteriales bacterium]|nr:tetratricopeptide repeat protein [Flavobacteriales bacterium]MCB9198566.1 tetratricopeptide repeat protein [Flavobacteriales bacterium]
MLRIIYLLSLLLFVLNLSSQTASELHQMAQDAINNDPNLSKEYAEKLVKMASPDSKDMINGLNDIGNAHYYLDEYEDGEKSLLASIEMAQKIDYPQGIAEASVIMGNIYILQGKFTKGLNYFTEALNIYEKMKDHDGMAHCYNGLGTINLNQEHYEKALEYFNKALENGGDIAKGDSYSYISQIYLRLEAYDDAAKYADEAIKIGKKNEDTYVQASGMDIKGVVASINKEYKKADEYLKEALSMKMDLEDMQGTAMTLNYIGKNYKSMDQIDSAMTYILKAHEIADEIGAMEELRIALGELAKLYAIVGQYEIAFVHQTRFIEVNEAIFNDQASKKIAEMEAEMEAKLQKEQIALLEKDKEFQEKMVKIYIGFGIFIFLILIGGAAMIYNRYQVKKRAHADLEQKNHIIEEQKHILEEKNTEILDSITYAKRIQTAILPSDRYFAENLPEAFVLYKPKDIIAGDFYWLEYHQEQNKLLFASADCTGHGVPGAMVSVVCNNALNRSVREFELLNPSLILDKTRELVIEQFEKSESEVKDGMDISLIALNRNLTKADSGGGTIEWSGANNPLWIVRSSEGPHELNASAMDSNKTLTVAPNVEAETHILFEIKPDKQPIGKYAEPKPFTNWKVELHKGDTVYIFTDGFADQFGGDKGKKFMASKMKKLLLSIQDQPIQQHQQILDQTFEEYRGPHEQIDDVCIIGMRI